MGSLSRAFTILIVEDYALIALEVEDAVRRNGGQVLGPVATAVARRNTRRFHLDPVGAWPRVAVRDLQVRRRAGLVANQKHALADALFGGEPGTGSDQQDSHMRCGRANPGANPPHCVLPRIPKRDGHC